MPHLYELLFNVFAFVLGAAIGSFLNVCIYRLPLAMRVNEPRRSFCPSCKYQIPWHCNLPLLSWLTLRGKCANCSARISFRYFGVELLTGLLFLAVWTKLMRGPETPWLLAFPYWILVSLLVVATFIDFEHFIIPDEITWGGAVAGAFLSYALPPLMQVDAGRMNAAAVLPGLVLGAGAVWLATKLYGPLREMRAPRRWLAGTLAAFLLCAGLAWMLDVRPAAVSLARSLGGAAAGYCALWAVVELGKLAFGKKRLAFDKPEPFTWTRRETEADFVVGEEKMLWSDFFTRGNERLTMTCPEIEIDGQRFENADLVFTLNDATCAGRHFALTKTDTIRGTVREAVLPREAMGFGDVKFIACIGAFLGWKAVVFTIVAGATLGALIGGLMVLVGRSEWSAKIPFGPYLAVGALLWIFTGPEWLAWYLRYATGG